MPELIKSFDRKGGESLYKRYNQAERSGPKESDLKVQGKKEKEDTDKREVQEEKTDPQEDPDPREEEHGLSILTNSELQERGSAWRYEYSEDVDDFFDDDDDDDEYSEYVDDDEKKRKSLLPVLEREVMDLLLKKEERSSRPEKKEEKKKFTMIEYLNLLTRHSSREAGRPDKEEAASGSSGPITKIHLDLAVPADAKDFKKQSIFIYYGNFMGRARITEEGKTFLRPPDRQAAQPGALEKLESII